MPKIARATFAALLLLTPFTWAQDDNYFPIKDGASWTFRDPNQPKEPVLVMVVAGKKSFGDQECWKIETRRGKKNELLGYEHVAVKKDGLYRYAIDDADITPALQFLKLPFTPNETYPTREWRIGEQQSLKGTFTSGKKEKIKVQGKEYDTISVEWKAAEKSLTMTYYFAKDVGIVKQVLVVDNSQSVLELVP